MKKKEKGRSEKRFIQSEKVKKMLKEEILKIKAFADDRQQFQKTERKD